MLQILDVLSADEPSQRPDFNGRKLYNNDAQGWSDLLRDFIYSLPWVHMLLSQREDQMREQRQKEGKEGDGGDGGKKKGREEGRRERMKGKRKESDGEGYKTRN